MRRGGVDRNVANLDLCLPEHATEHSAAQPASTLPLRQRAASPAGVSVDAAVHATIFPVTLLCQGEGASYEHQSHCCSAQSHSGAVPAGVAHSGCWPVGLHNRAGGGETGVDLGYAASCEECSASKAIRDAQEDDAFGDLLSGDQRFSASRFAPPRLRALVSVASLPLCDGASAAGCRPAQGAGLEKSEARSQRPGADSIRYSLVLVTQDGSQPVLKEVLRQAHEYLHARLIEALAARRAHEDGHVFPCARGAAEGHAETSELVLRLLFNSQPLAQHLEHLMQAVSAPRGAAGGTHAALRPRAAPTLFCQRGQEGHSGPRRADEERAGEEAGAGVGGDERLVEVRGGEMWIWGGSVRVPLQSPQFDATLGLVSLGSAEMLVRVLGKDVLVLWRSLLLRRRIVLVADSVEEVARGVCGALALIASPCIDFAARDGQAPPIIDSVFPYIALGQTGALESAALPLAHWPSECAKAPEAASLGRVGGGASGACAAPNAAAALNALPFYLAGVVSSHGAPGGFAAEGGPGIEGSGKRWVRGLLGGLSTAQVLLLHACVNC